MSALLRASPLKEITPPTIVDPIHELKDLCAPEMRALDNAIDNHLKNDVGLLEAVMKHLIMGGGKRLRPLLTIACYKALEDNYSLLSSSHPHLSSSHPHLSSSDLIRGSASDKGPQIKHDDSGSKIIDLAAAIEFIHNATLLHDDVVDESALRHGKPSSNEVFGSKASILVGDFLFAKAFELMLGCDESRVLPILAKVSQTITQGEVFQLGYIRTFDLSFDVMLHIIGTKTAALFAASTEIGAAFLGLDLQTQQRMHAYGRNLGVTFQIIDDLLDYIGNADILGKGIGDDLREGKVTLPLYIAHRDGTTVEQKFLENLIVQESISDANLNSVLTILESTQSALKCLTFAEDYARKAADSLDFLPDSNLKAPLISLPKKLLTRAQ